MTRQYYIHINHAASAMLEANMKNVDSIRLYICMQINFIVTILFFFRWIFIFFLLHLLCSCSSHLAVSNFLEFLGLHAKLPKTTHSNPLSSKWMLRMSKQHLGSYIHNDCCTLMADKHTNPIYFPFGIFHLAWNTIMHLWLDYMAAFWHWVAHCRSHRKYAWCSQRRQRHSLNKCESHWTEYYTAWEYFGKTLMSSQQWVLWFTELL